MNNTEREMINSIMKNKTRLSTAYQVAIPNCFTQHDNEADLFLIRKSGFCDEVEVKITRSDFLNDKKKRVTHRGIEEHEWTWRKDGLKFCPNTKPKRDALLDGDLQCNYFWYALKNGIAKIEEVPEFAGVIIVHDDGCISVARQPKRLKSTKLDFEQRFKYARLLHYRFWGKLA